MSVISRPTAADLEVVTKFFGIDMDGNRHLFRAAADANGDAFATTMSALASAVRSDRRWGINERISRHVNGVDICLSEEKEDKQTNGRRR